jgi:hypothetical protein
VEDTFNEIRNTVENSKIEGKVDIFNTSWLNKAVNKIIIAIDIFNASKKSSKKAGIGMIKKMIEDMI